MKKILKVVVALIAFSLTTTPLFAQLSIQQKFEQTKSDIDLPQGDSVDFDKIDAYTDGNGVFIKWNTKFEIDNLGFNMYRVDGKEAILVNQNLIAGTYIQNGINSKLGNSYTFFDPQGSFNSVYRIENLSIKGQNQASQMFYPIYENDLRKVSGSSSQELINAKRESRSAIANTNPNLPSDLKNAAETSNSLTDINKQREIAGQPGVKIGVKEEGIYRVTVSELQTAGFDINSNSANWQLYLNGIEQAVNVVNGQYVEFYGNGIDIIDTDTNIYFLTVGNVAGKRMRTTIRRPIGGNVVGNNFEFISEKIQRTIYFPSLLNGDEQNYFGATVTSASTNVDFEVNSPDYSVGKANIKITLQGVTNNPHKVEVKVNGTSLGFASGSNLNSFTGEFGIPVNLLNDGTNTLNLKSTAPGSDFSFFTKVNVEYKRQYVAKQNQLKFYTRNLRVTNLTGFTTSDLRVLDITYPDAPTLITNAGIEPADKFGTTFNVSLPAHRRRTIYAFANSQVKQPVSVTQNFPSTLSATSNQADMLIIAPREWASQANDWANYRQTDGLNTIVVNLEDTYDEFAFGVKGHKGIVGFLEFAHNNWQTPPGYVLLLGDATNDPRNYTASGDVTYMPIKFIDTLYGETISDEALSDFDNDGLAEISIGRIPAKNIQDINNILSKVQRFELTVSSAPSRGSLCASDLPNGYDFAGLCGRIHNELPPSIPVTGVNRGQPDAHNVLMNEINAGKYIVNYSGHGTAASWENTSFFTVAHVPLLTNHDDLSIFLSLTCLNGYFVRPNVDGLSETLLKATNGGAPAVWSSTGETTPDVQEVMAKRFFNQLGNNPSMIRIGDLVEDAKSSLVGGRDVRLSWGLLGDPAMKVK